jgi:undecaprenyl-diphosphatase
LKKEYRLLICSAALLFVFIIFTVLVSAADVRPVGFGGSDIGFAALNTGLRGSLGESKFFDVVSDLILILSLMVAALFAAVGVIQLLKKKKLFKVDHAVLLLGAVYLLIVLFYAIFEIASVNFRPNAAEASYPSSHVFIVLAVTLTAAVYVKARCRDKKLTLYICAACAAAAALTAVCRLFSGDHWFTDIVGGLLLGGFLATLYGGALTLADAKMKSVRRNSKHAKSN